MKPCLMLLHREKNINTDSVLDLFFCSSCHCCLGCCHNSHVSSHTHTQDLFFYCLNSILLPFAILWPMRSNFRPSISLRNNNTNSIFIPSSVTCGRAIDTTKMPGKHVTCIDNRCVWSNLQCETKPIAECRTLNPVDRMNQSILIWFRYNRKKTENELDT